VKPFPAEIKSSLMFEETQARIAYGLSEDAYEEMPGNPVWCIGEQKSKAHVVTWYRLSQQIQIVANEIQGREIERKSKMRH